MVAHREVAQHSGWPDLPEAAPELGDYLANYYTSRTAKLNPRSASGLGGDELGAAAMAYVKGK